MGNATGIPVVVESFYMYSGSALTEKLFVKPAADDQITQITGATDYAIGLLLDDTARTDVKVRVLLLGEGIATAGGTCTRGKFAKITATGAVEDATPANTERIVGLFLESATSGNDVRLLVFPNAMPAS